MLSQVGRAGKRDEHVVFLGWEPHPMNANHKMAYLEGGDDWFGRIWAVRRSSRTFGKAMWTSARMSASC